ncbi:MAG TPA: 3'-5' exonuclease [Cyclobacteriaceae bacterium]|nr:3'-5' exonuclease [Cyclobacteriaceae bacterium]
MNFEPDKTNISNDEINLLPLGAFEGEIVVVEDGDEVHTAIREISHHKKVGFDTETKPVFVRGHFNQVAILQIALPNKVFIFRLKATGVTPEMAGFLSNSGIEKVGVAVRDDIKALQHLRPFTPGGFVDLAPMAKAAGLEVESVKKLTGLLLGFRISKSAQTSNWEADVLNDKQISYAATDAWVCLQIYDVLISRL